MNQICTQNLLSHHLAYRTLKLHLHSPPAFQVERIKGSNCGSRMCVWGSKGVTVMELPARWGRSGLFESGNYSILCKSATLDERFLYSQTEVRSVQWHPTSLSRLLVLVSDNTLRLYNVAVKTGPKLVKVITIGPKPHGLLAGRTFLDSLGDTAVDFTPTPDSEHILILRGNGDVYMMPCDIEAMSSNQPKITGPLAMYPPADDNYGTDSCSIIALGSPDAPPVVVVATCSAALYHCLLLPHPTERDEGDSHALYVIEAVELNMVLTGDAELEYSYPVHLYPPPTDESDSHALYVTRAVELNMVLTADAELHSNQLKITDPLAMYPPADDNYGTDSCSIIALGSPDAPPVVVVATCSAALYHCLLLPHLKITGSLAMYPPADDNYGTDSCSIIALGSPDAPPVVAVATCSAALYHCLLLPHPTERDEGDSHALYVIEAVELNMVLTGDAELEYSYPVHLYPCTNNVYACIHAAGVHTISLPIMDSLKDYAQANEEESETVLSALCSKPSSARHLVCTVGPRGAVSPPCGLTLNTSPLPLLNVLCSDGQMFVRWLEPYIVEEHLYQHLQTKTPSLGRDEFNAMLHERQKMTFTAIIQEILAKNVSQPVLNMDKSEEPSLKETLEFLTQVTMKLRGEYIAKQQRAYDVIVKKMKALANLSAQHENWTEDLKRQKMTFTAIIQEILAKNVSQPVLNMDKSEEPSLKETLEFLTQVTMKLRGEYIAKQQRAYDVIVKKMKALANLSAQHESWTEDLKKDIDDVNLKSTVLKEKCMLAEKRQEDLKIRLSTAVRKLRHSGAPSAAERELLTELERHRHLGARLQEHVAQLRAHSARKAAELQKWRDEYKKKDIALGKSHSDAISSILRQQTTQISTLIEEAKLIKDQLSIV
ncbi:nuclear pore complex protein Nup88 [Ostrinia furnacalis]|uniref:nuclear pore complex protein Nup88 n=1 Tax=Ostrinia furnacalis TaxID=93504 RepID=UPI00103F92DD|nr:nuclear pore complex protein Nup88 [Ostrinia furnacalis]